MKKIMILGAGILQLPAIQKAHEMGLEVIAVDMNPNAIGFNADGVVKEVISTIDIPEVVAAAKKHNINGVMTLASDLPMRAVAAVAKEMGLVGISEDTAFKATDKSEMRRTLKEYGVPIPSFYRIINEEELKEAAECLPTSFILKPADNSGSRGIVLVKDKSDTKDLFASYEYSRNFSHNGIVLAEEYMCGPEVSVETLTVGGECHVIQITDKLTTGAPHFVEMGHSQPTMLCSETVEKIKSVAKAANKAIGITNGPSHTEIIITDEGPKIVELGARLGGDCITTHLVPLSTGIDMVECCIKIALGEEPKISRKYEKGAAIRYFHQSPGKVQAITGIEDAKRTEGIKQISIVHGIGETVTEVENSTSRMGFLIAQSNSAQNAINVCDEALQKIELKIK